MTNDIKMIEDKFVTAMGSGVAATGHLVTIVQDLAKSGVGGTVASVIARLAKKGDTQGARAVRSIVGTIFIGSKVVKAKDGKLLLSMKDAELDQEALERLVKAGGEKLSIRDTLVKRVKGETEKKEIVLPEYAEKLVKRMAKEGFSQAALVAAIQAVKA